MNSDMILAVDMDLTVHEQQSAEWLKLGIRNQRVDTMSDAINVLKNGAEVILVAINEDSIPNFMLQLPALYDASNFPIFVLTSTYEGQKKLDAMRAGAFTYDSFNKCVKHDVLIEMEYLYSHNRWAKRPKNRLPLVGGDIIISPLRSRRNVIVNETEITLANLEFDVLYYLIANERLIVKYAQLIRKVWGEEYTDRGNRILLRTVERLRRKLAEVRPDKKYIVTERGVGYKFVP